MHVREVVAALDRPGHDVLTVGPVMSNASRETPAECPGPLLHLPHDPEVVPADVVADGATGLLDDPGDVDTVVTACTTVLDDPSLAARLAAAGAEVEARCTWDANAERSLTLARGLLAGRSG